MHLQNTASAVVGTGLTGSFCACTGSAYAAVSFYLTRTDRILDHRRAPLSAGAFPCLDVDLYFQITDVAEREVKPPQPDIPSLLFTSSNRTIAIKQGKVGFSLSDAQGR